MMSITLSINKYLPWFNKSMLKSFDFFRKIRTDQQLTSTTGGFFTIISLICALILIIFSVRDFYNQQFHTFLGIKNDDSQYLPMQLDIVFNKMPCNAITIQFYDQMEYIESNLEKKLTLENIQPNSETGEIYERDSDSQREREKLKNNIEQGVKCRIKGTLSLPKTPGTLIFKPTAHNNLILNLQNQLIEKTRMSYRIDKLSFGEGNNSFKLPIARNSYYIQKFINQLQDSNNSKKYIQNFHNQTRKLDYFNHLKIIPVIMERQHNQLMTQAIFDKLFGFQKYRYSLRSGVVQSFDDPFEGVMFMTEIEPINIIYRLHRHKLYDLVVQILAIVGGTVATLGIVNSLSHFFLGIK